MDPISLKMMEMVDNVWKIGAGFAGIYLIKEYVKIMWIYFKIRWSFKPYTGIGNRIRFKIDGPYWKIWKVSLSTIYLELIDQKKSNGESDTMMKMPLSDYWNARIIYKKV